MRCGLLPLAGLALSASIATIGCSERQRSAPRETDFVEAEITRLQNLGPLDAAVHPARKDIWVVDPNQYGEERHPGGIVLREIGEGSPLAGRTRPGDVIYRIGDRWLPNVADPGEALIGMLEDALANDGPEFELGFLRRGKPQAVTLSLDLLPVDDGLPGLPGRSREMGRRAVDWLAGNQAADGSFGVAEATPESRLAVTALAGLAFLSAGSDLGQGPHRDNLQECMTFIRGQLETSPSSGGALGHALSLGFLAELLGKSMHPDLMQDLAGCLGAVLSMQDDEGGWPMAEPRDVLGYSDVTLATNQVLLALGAAERAGVQGSPEPIEKACKFLKSRTNQGQVVFVTDEGFDRRCESGRSAAAAAALRALNVVTSDPFFSSLVEYHRPLVRAAAESPRGRGLHFLNSALLARQAGDAGWLTFHHEWKHQLVALQAADGSYGPLPGPAGAELLFDRQVEGPSYWTAIAAIVLHLPAERLPLHLAQRKVPMQPRRDGDGKVKEGGAAPGEGPPDGLPAGAKMMQFSSMEEAREFLESMGMDPDALESGVGEGKVIRTVKKSGDDN